MLTKYRTQIDKKRTELELRKVSKKKHMKQLKDFQEESDILHEVREIFQKASILTQNYLAEHLSTIVTKAIQAVFYDKDISFLVEFVERRNSTECDMYFVENNRKFSLLESRGYGMVDIASFALKVSYILLDNSEDLLAIDEPFRNLSEDNHEEASRMIKELSTELDMQFIISTHIHTLRQYADKAFHVIQSNGESKVY